MPTIMTILYPRTASSTFDLDYYLSKHMPLAAKYWYPRGMQRYHVETHAEGPYTVKAECVWDSLDAFKAAKEVEEEIKEIFGDVKNYSNEAPVQWFGEVVGTGEKSDPTAAMPSGIITVLYPRTATATFNLNYYLSTHLRLATKYWYPRGMKRYHVETYAEGPYAVKAELLWDSLDAWKAATEVEVEMKELVEDIKKYSSEDPVRLYGEVVGTGEKP
ncbi:hypothetical protein BU16DRAFT_524326 [Lophium mytilinum]|uniref:EthD domain-containing protein n=1 Tax=Lophium mytilinum TaxID=390894 RepID=A0A6A6R427_9PEZI|nr:hypothetical protein BU16DRAFT_524326 [Lophium mytilinum]